MAFEESRAELYSLLRRDLSEETATALMQALPPFDWIDVARRSDIDALRSEFRGDLVGLKGEFAGLKGEFAVLRGEFVDLKGEFADLRGEFVDLKGEFADLRGEFADVRGDVADLKGEIAGLRARVDTQVPRMVLANVPLAFGVAGLVLAAVRL